MGYRLRVFQCNYNVIGFWVAVALGVLLLPVVFAAENPGYKHIVIIDAGSSGTRIHLFAYKKGKNNTINTIKEQRFFAIYPGVSDYVNRASKIKSHLEALLTHIDGELTAQQKKITPIYLFATAGMRNLPKNQQVPLMKAIQQAMVSLSKQYGYAVPDEPRRHFSMIKGQAEGVFGWLTVNQLMNKLTVYSLMHKNTYGVVDLGGASAEITFQTDQSLPSSFKVHLTYGNKRFQLYSYSYPVYGHNTARRMIYQAEPIKSRVCSIIGQQGNFSACTQLITSKLYSQKKYERCKIAYDNKTCNRLGEPQPPINNIQFIGISNYYPTFNLLGLTNQISSLSQLKAKASDYCATPLSTIMKKHPGFSSKVLDSHCFNAAWIYALLDGYGFQKDMPLITTQFITGFDSDWPMGAAIYLLTQPDGANNILLGTGV